MIIKKRLHLTFEPGQEEWYTIAPGYGELTLTGGNPGAYINGTTNPRREAIINVNLPQPSKVTFVSADGKGDNGWLSAYLIRSSTPNLQQIFNPSINVEWVTGSNSSPPSDSPHTWPSDVIQLRFVAGAPFNHGAIDNVIIEYEYEPTGPDEPNNRGECSCEVDVRACQTSVGNPISIRHGEKREVITDLSMVSANQELAFTRYYSQFSQTNTPSLLGLGWNHNHNYRLTEISGATNKISIRLPNGGEALFTEQSASTNHYVGVEGVDSTVEWNTLSSQYTLTNFDQSQLIFNSSGNLILHKWPTGEEWIYSYVDDKLSEVDDGYGRKLVFRYFDTGDFNEQIYRVGDHSFDDTNPLAPIGRYVEFDYALNKVIDSSGVIADGTKALLTTVRDVRGNIWTYEYYGQSSGETNVEQLNLLVNRKSPSVDVTGNGVTDGTLTIETVSYTLSSTELAVNGGMEANSNWTGISGALPSVQEQSSVERDEGTYSWYVDADTNEGIEGNEWDLIAGRTYLITARVYPVSGTVKMRVTEEGFDTESQGTGDWETLYVVYNPLTSAVGCKLQFIAFGGPAEFYVDEVSIIEHSVESIHQESGEALLVTDYEFQPDEQNITTETRAGKVITHHFFNGVLGGTEDAAQTGLFGYQIQDENYRPIIQVDANGNETELSWINDGKLLDRVIDPFGATTEFIYYDDGLVEGALKASIDAEGLKTTYIYDGTLRQPNLIVVSKPNDPEEDIEIPINGDMEANTGWTDVGNPDTHEQTLVEVDAGEYARYIEASEAGDGIESVNWNLETDHTYLILARVYPVSGIVKMQVPGISEFDQASSDTGAWETLRAVYTANSNVSKTLQFIAEGGAAEFYVDSVHILDVISLLSIQEFRYDNKGRTVFEAVLDKDTAVPIHEVLRTYSSVGNGAGLLESVTQVDLPSRADNITTTYSYDSAGRVIKTQQSSLFGSCVLNYTVYDVAGNVVATACINPEDTETSIPTDVEEARSLYDTNDPIKRENKVTTYEYDTLGRRVKATINDGTNNPDKQVNLTFYDALNRVVRTISNYVNQSSGSPEASGLWIWNDTNSRWEKSTTDDTAITFGAENNQNIINDTTYNARGMVKSQRDALGNVTLYGYDDAGRLVKTIQSASDPSYNNDYIGLVPDPTLENYEADLAPDKDIIAIQAYDAVGNLVKSIDPLGHINFTVYDALNRPIKTVQSAHNNATVSLNVGDVGYEAEHDPRSESYAISVDPDRDLIQTTEYDRMGRVIRTQRLLENRPENLWETTLYGYDSLGRQIKIIQKASDPDYDLTSDPSLSAYVEIDASDQDIITQTVYDPNRRVMHSIDAMGSRTWMAYDGLGRQVRTVINANGTATDGGSNDPRSDSYVASNDADKDLITLSAYDVDGRVESTEDTLGRVTRNVYDARGRVIRTISNYVEQDEDDPGKWIWSNTNNRWENSLSDSTPLDHGAENDLNIISDTVYDVQGRVLESYDHRRNVTRHVYDGVGRRLKTITNYIPQGSTDPADWVWDSGDSRWEDGAGNAINFGSDQDQNRISQTTYDLAGRVIGTRDAAGVESRFEYDALGRRVESITNYVNGIFNPALPDEDLASTTIYNKAGQVTRTIDPRGTHTTFSYDQAGRRLTVTTAADSPLEAVNYTCYDKAGRVLRTIQNWQNDPNAPSPDERDESAWLFLPEEHGPYQDRDLITAYGYDAASRRVAVTDPVGNTTYSSYYKDGMLQWLLDPEGIASQYRYDALRRRNRVVQVWVDQAASDPGAWTWDSGQSRWEYPGDNPINHGTDNDQNIIVDVTYDKAGRVISQRDPRGNLTTYSYDLLDRRIELTNPLSQTWNTAYANLSDGKTRVTQTYPGITGSSDYPVQREFDRLGRLQSTAYGAPSVTPDVRMSYDSAGNRASMSEYTGSGFTGLSRETLYTYDRLHRLTEVGFDTDGSGSIDEAVSYEYDAGGLRTKLTLPGDLEVVYSYDARGRLTGLTDWDNQQTQFAYDQAGRHIATERANRLRSRYQFDAAGRLRILRHTHRERTLAHFAYQVDKRGNRTEALEVLAHPTTTTATTIAYNDAGLALSGAWAEVSGFKQTTDLTASLKLMFLSSQALLSMGTGPDHSRYDVYIDQTLWQSFDGYAPSPGQRDIAITLETDSRPLQSDGPHLLEIRSRAERSPQSSGHKLRFKQLLIEDRTWTLHTIGYTYDQLARLKEARYAPGIHRAAADANLLRHYRYNFDRAGNRTAQSIALNGASPTVTNYTYNAANQLVSDGTNTLTYDPNGNLTSDGVNSYVWDRANRLLSMGGASYQYDGEGRRTQQTVSSIVTKYLLDTQPGLAVVLSQTEGSDVTRFVHAPRGIHARQDASNDWHWTVQDGLGTVRIETDNSAVVEGAQNLDPFGNLIGSVSGTIGTPYGFTGELVDGSGLLDLRARRYAPGWGVFTALDPFEGMASRPLSLNGYLYVEGNVPNMVDPSGMILENPARWNSCFVQVVTPTRDCSCYYRTDLAEACQRGEINDCKTIDEGIQCGYPLMEKNHTVIIRFGGGSDLLGASGYSSLGTLTDQGIWTHDHFAPEWIYPFSTPAAPGTPVPPTPTPVPGQPSDNVAEIQRNLFIEFEGQHGKIRARTTDLDIRYAPNLSSAGSLLITPRQTYLPTGQSIANDWRAVGTPGTLTSLSRGDISRPGTIVSYVFIPGENVAGRQHEATWGNLCVGKGIVMEVVSESIVRQNRLQVATSFAGLTSPGDSGGGVFKDGKLFGVTATFYNYAPRQHGNVYGFILDVT